MWKKVYNIPLDYRYTIGNKQGNTMSIDLIALILFCVWGCGLTTYHLGRRVGIEDAVQHMADSGIIEFDDK